MVGRLSETIVLSSDSDTSSDSSSSSSDSYPNFPPEELRYTFAYAAFHFARPLAVIMAERSRDEQGIERAQMVEEGLDDLRWVHPKVKMATTSLHWRNPKNIKELETHFRTEEEMDGIDFKPVELDE